LNDIAVILAENLGVPHSAAIDEDTRFFADLGLASIDAVVLSEAIQAHYGRALPFHELMAEIGRRTDRDLTIGELVTFIIGNL
jgi:acyl carrier protein